MCNRGRVFLYVARAAGCCPLSCFFPTRRRKPLLRSRSSVTDCRGAIGCRAHTATLEKVGDDSTAREGKDDDHSTLCGAASAQPFLQQTPAYGDARAALHTIVKMPQPMIMIAWRLPMRSMTCRRGRERALGVRPYVRIPLKPNISMRCCAFSSSSRPWTQDSAWTGLCRLWAAAAVQIGNRGDTVLALQCLGAPFAGE